MPASLVALLVLLRLLIRSRVDLQLGKLGSAPSNRRASTLAEETPENNSNGLVGSRNGAIPVGPVYPLLPVSSGSASITEP